MSDLPEPMQETPSQETLITFPCDFPIKVMGETQDGFLDEIIQVIQAFDAGFNAQKVEVRGSTHGKFTSLTCSVYVESKTQLDAVYLALTQHPMVKVVL